MSDRVPVRDDLRDVEPYGAPQLDVPVRLNTNETPQPPPPAFLAAVADRLRELELNRYPDRDARALRAALAAGAGVPPDQVWVGNGSNEVQLQLLQAYGGPGRRVLLARPGYSFHPLVARVSGTQVVEVRLPEDLVLRPDPAAAAVARHDPDLTLLVSPHNPSGVRLDPGTVRAVHDAGRGLVVLDEAYVEFAPDPDATLALLAQLPRLVLSRTFSKAFRLAGLRLGYLLGPSWVVEDLQRVRLPYHLDALTQAAGLVALEQRAALTTHLAATAIERERVARLVGALDRVERVWPSQANFLLLRTDEPRLFELLLERGVLVRDFSTTPGLAGCVRVTIGTPEEDDALVRALGEVLGQ